jgi:recombination protein RecT
MSQNVPQTTQKGQSPQDALMTALKDDLEDITPYLEKLLPHKGQIGRFVQMTLVAVLRDPNLLICNRRSLLLALLWCAQRDLEPGVDDGCWLIPYKKIVVPVPGYKGLIKKAVETETATDVQPYGIYKNDDIEFGLGLDPYLRHQPPKLGLERGELIGAYVVITKPGGSKRFHVMDRPAIEKIRASSASWQSDPEKSIWTKWEDAMFLKTVIKQGFKYLPVKSAFRDLLADDGRIEAGEAVAALLREGQAELPPGLETGEEEPPPAPEPIDTSGFDKLLDEKLKTISSADEYKLRHQRVEEFVTETAASQKKAKVLPAQVKVKAAANFAGFWTAFEAWEAKKYPAPPSAPAAAGSGTPQHSPSGEEPPPPAGASPDPGEDECPFPLANAGPGEAPPLVQSAPPAATGAIGADPTFEGRRLALWDTIIDKKAFDEVKAKFGIDKTTDITPENIDNIKWLVDNYTPSKGKTTRGGKK